MDDASTEIVPYEPVGEKRPWITITVAGTTFGIIVAAATFAATVATTSAAATTTAFTMEMLGELAGLGATSLIGPAAGLSVKVVSREIAKTSESALRQGGQFTAAAVAAVAGATTALSITVGTRIIAYSVEYGGAMTRDIAAKFSEAYLMFKARHSAQFLESGDINALQDDDWVMVNRETEVDGVKEGGNKEDSGDKDKGNKEGSGDKEEGNKECLKNDIKDEGNKEGLKNDIKDEGKEVAKDDVKMVVKGAKDNTKWSPKWVTKGGAKGGAK